MTDASGMENAAPIAMIAGLLIVMALRIHGRWSAIRSPRYRVVYVMTMVAVGTLVTINTLSR